VKGQLSSRSFGIDAYWKELFDVAGYAFATVENYVRCLEKYFDYARNMLEIDPLEADPKHLLKWMTHLKEQKLSRSTLIHHKSALTHFFSRSFGIVRLGRREHNPADTLFTIRKKKSELNQPISADVACQLLRSVDCATWIDERNFMIISVLWALGLRIGELTALKVGDFEPEHGSEIGLLRVRGKGQKQRALFVVEKLYRNLVNYLAHSDSPKRNSQPLFPIHNNHDKAVSANRLQRKLKEIVKDAGITERITAHVLRHSFATHMYARGVPISAIEAMLGHDSTDETSIYIHVPESNKRQALEKINIERSA
jgi:integrase/recombinase XerD